MWISLVILCPQKGAGGGRLKVHIPFNKCDLKNDFQNTCPPPLLALDPPPFSSYKKYAEIWCLIIIYFSDLKCKIFNTNKSQSFILFPRAIKAFWLFLFYFSWELINRATVEIKRFRVFWNHGVSNSLRVWHSDRKKRLIYRW